MRRYYESLRKGRNVDDASSAPPCTPHSNRMPGEIPTEKKALKKTGTACRCF